MANLSAEEPDALMHAPPGPWEPWRVTARATQPAARNASGGRCAGEQLAALDPELTELLTFARMVGNGCRKWHDVERGFNPFKNDIVKLVGFCGKHRGHPVLGTRAAYEVTYWKLHNAGARDRRAAD
jgi:hypothetical protein